MYRQFDWALGHQGFAPNRSQKSN